MIGLNEVKSALDGSWLLFRNRPEGMNHFDQSIQGFWRSFFVIFWLIPAIWAGLLAKKEQLIAAKLIDLNTFSSTSYWYAHVLGVVLEWIALPVLLALLAASFGVSRRYVPFVVARNWSALLANVPFLVVNLLYLIGVLPIDVVVLLSFLCLVFAYWLLFQVAKITLQAPTLVTVGVVTLDIMLMIVVLQLIGRLWN